MRAREEFKKLPSGIQKEFGKVAFWYFEMFLTYAPKDSKVTKGLARNCQDAYHSGGIQTVEKTNALIRFLTQLRNPHVLDIDNLYNEFLVATPIITPKQGKSYAKWFKRACSR